jgi:hypothetical protein
MAIQRRKSPKFKSQKQSLKRLKEQVPEDTMRLSCSSIVMNQYPI